MAPCQRRMVMLVKSLTEAVDMTGPRQHKAASVASARTAWSAGGRMSRVAKGADCKSAGLRLRRFESYFSHHYLPPCRVSAGRAEVDIAVAAPYPRKFPVLCHQTEI